MQAYAFIPTRGGQEESTCFDLEEKMATRQVTWRQRSTDRYTDPHSEKELEGPGIRVPFAGTHRHPHTWEGAEAKSQAEQEQKAAHGRCSARLPSAAQG